MKINELGFIELEVGEIFKSADGKQIFKAVEASNRCYGCYFFEKDVCFFTCMGSERDDNTDVIFEKI